MAGNRPRIVLDARSLSHPQPGGFRTYVRSLLRGFSERGTSDLELVLYVDRPLSPDVHTPLPAHVQTRIVGTSRLHADWLHFARQLRLDKPDLVHGTANYLPLRLSGVASTLTLHDAMGIKPYPWDIGIARNARERFINRYWAYMTRTSALQAKRVITAAVGAQTEIQSVLPVPSERFAIVGHGIALAPPCQPKPRQAQTILAVASPDPRKNLAVLYAALSPQFAPVWNNNAPLLRVVGTSAKAAERAEEALKRNGIVRYEILRSPSDLELSNLYAESAVFVFPSLLEGFGLPPLEAMQRGCAVLASSAPVMPEVLGESAVYFDPHNAEELAGKLSGLLAQPNEMYERGKAGQGYAAQFTCKQMANKTANVWKAVLNA